VWWHIELRSGVPVDQKRVDVVCRLGANLSLMNNRKSRERMARPSTGILWSDQQRMVNESRFFTPRIDTVIQHEDDGN
jgi:hypothetical protein